MSEQTLFFKATRPDGTDFYTGTVDYDTLTRPWRSALGPIHPDDDDWSGDA